MVSRAMRPPFDRGETSASFHRLYQCRYLDRRKVREGVRYGIWQNEHVVVPYRATGIDDVRDISFALGCCRPQQWLARARQHLGGVALVEQRRTDRVSADRANTVREQQPA